MRPSNELTREESRELLAKRGAKKPAKYRNKKVAASTFFGQHTFDSIRERDAFTELNLLKEIGSIKLLLCQVPFRLPGRTRYVADFVVYNRDGTLQVIDAKGKRTETYQLKKRQVEEIYDVRITEV